MLPHESGSCKLLAQIDRRSQGFLIRAANYGRSELQVSHNSIRDLLSRNEFTIVESFEIPGQPARFSKIPQYLFDSKVGEYLNSEFPSGIWAHQAQALESLGIGSNVVVSTGTASGKSLIFRSLAFHRIMLNPSNRVVVFYPQRALVEDQLRGWRSMARSSWPRRSHSWPY